MKVRSVSAVRESLLTSLYSFCFIDIIPTLFIRYNERERYQRLSLYEGIRPDVTDLESILMR